ncbi:MAG: thiazole biosynthesis protein [Sodalis sp. (in: enterobacteria)]
MGSDKKSYIVGGGRIQFCCTEDSEEAGVGTYIREMTTAKEHAPVAEIKTTAGFCSTDVVLDIRLQDEQKGCPLTLANVVVQTLPFYKLGSHFSKLDQSKSYFLYCDRGVMSRLQALYLREQGFQNVKVYRP